jgi:hypothetical protein
MSLPTNRRWLIVLSLLAVVAVLAAAIAVSDYAAMRASSRYDQQRQKLAQDLRVADARGYTAEDLAPITIPFRSLQNQSEPLIPVTRAQFDDQRAKQVALLDAQLQARESQLLEQARRDASAELASARGGIEQGRSLGADDSDLNPLQKRLDEVEQTRAAAQALLQHRGVQQQGRALVNQLNALNAAQQAENQWVAQVSGQLVAQNGGDGAAIRKSGNDALADGRNDASVAAYMNRSAPFKGYDVLARFTARLEKYGQRIGSADPTLATQGAAGARIFAGQIHEALVGGLPRKAILISYADQHLWAYENGKVVQDTAVTTGRPQLPTDLGPMKVLRKDSPWKMHSPWPKGSPYWYPDTNVKMVVWFTNTGEGLHDADWQRCCWGPGSQYTGNASHGCIHLPDGAESFVYRWAEIGIPVVVYQGDGSAVGDQVSKISTDDKGNPLTGPKGV